MYFLASSPHCTYCKVECKECGCLLWSEHTKSTGICPECEDVDEADYDNLEERLEIVSICA